MRVSAESQVESLLSKVEQSGWRVHEHNPDTAGSQECPSSVRLPAPMIVDATNPNPIERGAEATVAIGQHLDPRCLESLNDVLRTRPPVVIAQYRESSKGRWNLPELVRQPVRLGCRECDEVATEQEDVGSGFTKRDNRLAQECRIGCRSRMKVRGIYQAECREWVGAGEDDTVLRCAYARPAAECPSQTERPVSGKDQGF